MHHRRRLGVVANQDGVEHLLTDVFGWLLPERIFAGFAQRLSPPVENVAESALAGAVSEKPFSSFSSILKLSTSTDGRREAP